jgi:hypothetical protein
MTSFEILAPLSRSSIGASILGYSALRECWVSGGGSRVRHPEMEREGHGAISDESVSHGSDGFDIRRR